MTAHRAVGLACFVALCVAAAPPIDAMKAEATRFEASMERAMAAFARGDKDAAIEGIGDSFFEFENSAFHGALAARDKSLYKQLEGAWLEVRARISAGHDAAKVARAFAEWKTLSKRARRTVGDEEPSPLASFVNSFLIMLREGFEAILVISALAAYLVRTDNAERTRDLYLGAAVAVVASVALWITASTFLSMSGADQELLEGVTMLVATVVLFSVSYWLLSKVEGRAWQQFVTRKVKESMSGGGRFGLAFMAFLVVFREGFETVLFYEALLAGGAGWGPLLAGIAVATVLLVALYIGVIRAGRRIPLRSFFGVTGGLLYLLAFKFMGDGLRELQEAGRLSVTPADWAPSVTFLQNWFGVHPTVETLAGQAVLLAFAVVGLVVTFRGMRNAAGGPEQAAA